MTSRRKYKWQEKWNKMYQLLEEQAVDIEHMVT